LLTHGTEEVVVLPCYFCREESTRKGAAVPGQPTNQACAADARGPPASLGPAPLPGSLSLSPDFPPWKKQQRAAHGRLRGKAIHPSMLCTVGATGTVSCLTRPPGFFHFRWRSCWQPSRSAGQRGFLGALILHCEFCEIEMRLGPAA